MNDILDPQDYEQSAAAADSESLNKEKENKKKKKGKGKDKTGILSSTDIMKKEIQSIVGHDNGRETNNPVHYKNITISDFGLSERHQGLIEKALDQINRNEDSIFSFFDDLGKKTSHYADEMLKIHQKGNNEEADKKLTEIIKATQAVNLSGSPASPFSKVPVLGKMFNAFRDKKNDIQLSLATVKEQMDILEHEVDKSGKNLETGNKNLEFMVQDILCSYENAGVAIVAGKLKLQKLREEEDFLKENLSSDPLAVQKLSNLQNRISELDNLTTSMITTQHHLVQSAQQAALIKHNNKILLQKIFGIKVQTIPSIKRHYSLEAYTQQQTKTIHLIEQIQDFTQEIVRNHADTISDNAKATAKLGQSQAITPETIAYVHEKMMSTVQAVAKINQEGAIQRRNTEAQIKALQVNQQQFVSEVKLLLDNHSFVENPKQKKQESFFDSLLQNNKQH